MTLKKLVSATTLALLLSAGVASAQTTGVTSTSTLPGTPNTGAGGDMAENILLLGSSALVAFAGILYLATRKPREM